MSRPVFIWEKLGPGRWRRLYGPFDSKEAAFATGHTVGEFGDLRYVGERSPVDRWGRLRPEARHSMAATRDRRGRRARGARRDAPGTRCEVGTRVQTLLLSRLHFPTATRAREWARDHGFASAEVDPGANFFRLRQAEPRAFRRGSLRTIRLRAGVMAVVGCPR